MWGQVLLPRSSWYAGQEQHCYFQNNQTTTPTTLVTFLSFHIRMPRILKEGQNPPLLSPESLVLELDCSTVPSCPTLATSLDCDDPTLQNHKHSSKKKKKSLCHLWKENTEALTDWVEKAQLHMVAKPSFHLTNKWLPLETVIVHLRNRPSKIVLIKGFTGMRSFQAWEAR